MNPAPPDTRRALVRTAAQCFEKVGISSTTVDLVCRDAGLSRTTFYRHFTGIDEVLIEITVEYAREAVAVAVGRAREATSFADKLTDFMMFMMTDIPESHWFRVATPMTRAASMVLATPGALRRITPALEEFLAQGRACGELRANLDTGRAAGWLLRNVWSLLTVPSEWSPSPEEHRKYLAEFAVPPLLAAPGQVNGAMRMMGRLDDIQTALKRVEGLLAPPDRSVTTRRTRKR